MLLTLLSKPYEIQFTLNSACRICQFKYKDKFCNPNYNILKYAYLCVSCLSLAVRVLFSAIHAGWYFEMAIMPISSVTNRGSFSESFEKICVKSFLEKCANVRVWGWIPFFSLKPHEIDPLLASPFGFWPLDTRKRYIMKRNAILSTRNIRATTYNTSIWYFSYLREFNLPSPSVNKLKIHARITVPYIISHTGSYCDVTTSR